LENPKRQLWVDIAKIFALILVVVGHYGIGTSYAKYIYWFHMPVFFLISGYLAKLPDNWSSFRMWFCKRNYQMLVPYCAYLILVTSVRYFYVYRYLHILEASFVMKDIPEVLFGGRLIGGYYTVFWFFICLYFTQVLFSALRLILKDNRLVIAVIVIAYLCAHIESWWMISHPVLVPWDLDVSLLAIAYYALGYYCKKQLTSIPQGVTLIAIIASTMLIAADYNGLIGYELNMKYVVYQHLFLDLLIPVIMAIAFLGTIQILVRSKMVRVVNQLSNVAVPVIYLHVPINSVLLVEYHFHYGTVVAVLIGFTVPAIISKLIFDRFSFTRFLFQGRPLRRLSLEPASSGMAC
jgi:fucose 4-O-acetylase-like acetyltransferase